MTSATEYAVLGLLGLTLLSVLVLLFTRRRDEKNSPQAQAQFLELKNERDTLRREVIDLGESKSQLSVEIGRAKGQIDSLTEQLTELHKVREDRNATREALASTQSELKSIRTELDQRDASLQNTKELETELRRQNHLLNAQKASLEADQESLKARVQERDDAIKALRESEKVLQKQVHELTARTSSLQADRENLEKRLTEQREWVEQQTKAFENRISVLTASLLKKQSEDARKQNKQTLEEMLTPFKTTLGEFKEQVNGFAREQVKEREGLTGQIKTLAEVHANLASQTDALAKALTHQNKQAGDWGEVQLTRYLESAGFEEGIHYKKQVTVQGQDGNTQRPDVILYLPEERQIIIDSKVSIKAWTDAHQTEDEAERKLLLKQHVESIRRHVNDLNGKDYTASPDVSTLDFVVMFMPIEAAYIAAASIDPHLFQEAFRKGVIVASPTLLLTILKLVSTLWNMHKQEENAEAVLELASKIHHKLMSFAKNFEDVGTRLDSARKAYQDGFGQLVDGKGSALKMLSELEKQGITTKKALPPKISRALQSAPDHTQDQSQSQSDLRVLEG